jgi:hypothetical protein
MFTVPNETPVTIPVAVITVALVVLLLVHVQPGMILPRSNLEFTHTMPLPVYAAGAAFTVTTAVTLPPPPKV